MHRIADPLQAATTSAPAGPQPLLLALVLSLRLREVFPQIRQSATLLVQWTREQLGLQRTWATEAETLAADLAAQRAAITDCLRNDPPAHRKKIEAALDEIQAHQLAHAAHLAPKAPAHLLRD
jgi:hypothetical protein